MYSPEEPEVPGSGLQNEAARTDTPLLFLTKVNIRHLLTRCQTAQGTFYGRGLRGSHILAPKRGFRVAFWKDVACHSSPVKLFE